MSTNWYNASLDARGSLNLPVEIKRIFGLGVGSPLTIREVSGVILLITTTSNVAQAQAAGALEAWVNERLQSTLPPALVTLGTTALAEAARTQRAREKHDMKMKEMQMQLEIHREKRRISSIYRQEIPQTAGQQVLSDAAAAPVNHQAIAGMLEQQRLLREAESARQTLTLPQLSSE